MSRVCEPVRVEATGLYGYGYGLGLSNPHPTRTLDAGMAGFVGAGITAAFQLWNRAPAMNGV